MICTLQAPDCRGDATSYPTVLLTPDGTQFASIALPELAVCPACLARVKIEDLIPDDLTWATIVKTIRMKGLLAPVRNLTSIQWVRLAEREARP